ncbi:unnamed protein product [Trichobilharzia szidati]|nr:unnamed protein product [Trichobilharzia szidati]
MCQKYSLIKLNCLNWIQLKRIQYFKIDSNNKGSSNYNYQISESKQKLSAIETRRIISSTLTSYENKSNREKCCYTTTTTTTNAKFMYQQYYYYYFYKKTNFVIKFFSSFFIIMMLFCTVNSSSSSLASASASLSSALSSPVSSNSSSSALSLSVSPGISPKRVVRAPITSRHQSINPRLLREIGEGTLRIGGVLTQLLDAIEFSVVQERTDPYLNIQYFIGYNRSAWFTVTPCTNVLNRAEFVASSAFNEPWEESKTYGLQLTKVKTYTSKWPNQKVRIEPFPGEKDPPNYILKNNKDTIVNIFRSRLHYTRSKHERDSINLRLYSQLGDAYTVRMSTRRSPNHAYDGYPILDKSLSVSACLLQDTNDTLDVSWNRAVSNYMRINYCVVVNAEENLYYRCTAMARLNQSVNYARNGEDDEFKRPKVFQETDHLRPRLIDNYVYKCGMKSITRIRLSPALTMILNQLPLNHSLKLFINVYAINKHMDISTAYPVRIIQHGIERCDARRKLDEIQVVYEPHKFSLLWNSDVSFKWEHNKQTGQLYYQPCSLPRDKSMNYTISLARKILSRNSPTTSNSMEKKCEYSINNHYVFRLCLNSSEDGVYYMQLNGDVKFKNGLPVGRYFFLSSNATSILPQKPEQTYYPTDISSIATQPSSNQTIFQIPPFLLQNSRHYQHFRSYRAKRDYYHYYYHKHHHHLFNNHHPYYHYLNRLKSKHKKSKQELFKYKFIKMNRYLRENIPSSYSATATSNPPSSSSIIPSNTDQANQQNVHIPSILTRRLRKISLKNGFQIGIDCTLHQVYISLSIHIDPHNYWIYTIPLACNLTDNISFMLDYINNMTNYCEFPDYAVSMRIRQTYKPIHCQTTQGMHTLELTIPAYHRRDYPRYYLVLIYASSVDDITGNYKQLFVRQILDTCNIISNGCYPKALSNCRQNFPSHLPPTFDPLMSSSVILNSNSSSQIPVCMIGE